MTELLDTLRRLSVLHAPPDKPFVLKSGKLSMHYIDVRLTALDARGSVVLAEHLFAALSGLGVPATAVAGVALGGCPLASGVSMYTQLNNLAHFNVLYVRPEAKGHGTGKLVEGKFTAGNPVVLLEDVVTTGGSTLKAIASLREAGLVVSGVVAVLDREEGGRALIEAECPFVALTTLKELLADG